MSQRQLPDDLFYVWALDDIDSSFYEDTDEPRPLFVCYLLRDSEDPYRADLIRGYDPRDGIFERPGNIVTSLGGIDAESGNPYRREIEHELLEEFECQRESMISRGTN
jgi:hypothetical protein